jgi:competence protein ComFC
MCEICGLPLPQNGLCPDCSISKPPYKILRSWLVFEGPIRNALHSLKYRRNIALGDALAQHMTGFVRGLCWPIDSVTLVPLGKKRLQERGYNQVGLFAKPLAAASGWHYVPRLMTRIRETNSQVGLSILERKENVLGAFQAAPSLVEGKTVLLIDDVATTGATLASCAEALLTAGAESVYALTLARALPRHGLHTV